MKSRRKGEAIHGVNSHALITFNNGQKDYLICIKLENNCNNMIMLGHVLNKRQSGMGPGGGLGLEVV